MEYASAWRIRAGILNRGKLFKSELLLCPLLAKVDQRPQQGRGVVSTISEVAGDLRDGSHQSVIRGSTNAEMLKRFDQRGNRYPAGDLRDGARSRRYFINYLGTEPSSMAAPDDLVI